MYATFPKSQKNTWVNYAFEVPQYLKYCNRN